MSEGQTPRELDGPAIRALRERLHMTQEELAAAVDVRAATVNRWENEHAKPLRVFQKRLRALWAAAEGGAAEGHAS